MFPLPTRQARGGDEEDNRDGDGERRRDGRALLPHRLPQVRADSHPHHRVRLHPELLHQLVTEPLLPAVATSHVTSRLIAYLWHGADDVRDFRQH